MLFAAILALVMLTTPAPIWLAAIIAAIGGLCISYIFFRGQRDAVTQNIVERRSNTGPGAPKNRDSDEDDALDNSGQ